MECFKFTTIAHADHVFCSPLGEAKADRLLELLGLRRGERVIDVGCGKGELLIRAAATYGVSGVGVDVSPGFLTGAQRSAAARGVDSQLEFVCEQAETFAGMVAEPYAAALCVGATHALGDLPSCLQALSSLVRPGGLLPIGHPYWRCCPHSDYLQALGARTSDYTDHAGNVAAAVAAGLVPLYSCTSNDDEWDDFEGLSCRAVERFIVEYPDDPDAAALRQRIRGWRDAYYRWGRDTLGFGFYLLQTPQA